MLSPKKGDPSYVTGGTGIFDGSEPWENPIEAQEAGDDQQRLLPLPPAPLVSLIRDLETNGDGGGRGKAWPASGPTYAQLVLESWLQHTQDFLDVT